MSLIVMVNNMVKENIDELHFRFSKNLITKSVSQILMKLSYYFWYRLLYETILNINL